MKRFWTNTRVVSDGQEFLIQLDSRLLKLPSGQGLAVPFQALAEGIASEWAMAGQSFTPDDLPLTRLATTAQDRVRLKHTEIVEQLTAFGMSDLLCYRAADEPLLAQREEQVWQPWIDWTEKEFGITLKFTSGIMHIEQSARCREGFTAHLSTMNEYQLAGLGVIVPALGSLVLGLAVEAGALAPDTACECANLGELWQEARWGTDDEATARRRAVAEDVAATAQFMILCQP
jgi:chaperone required for assembly of F1-ATPase